MTQTGLRAPPPQIIFYFDQLECLPIVECKQLPVTDNGVEVCGGGNSSAGRQCWALPAILWHTRRGSSRARRTLWDSYWNFWVDVLDNQTDIRLYLTPSPFPASSSSPVSSAIAPGTSTMSPQDVRPSHERRFSFAPG